MRSTFLALLATAVLSACAHRDPGEARAPDPGSRATDGAAAFMGYHGPVWRANTPAD